MPGRAGGVAPGGRTATYTESTLYLRPTEVWSTLGAALLVVKGYGAPEMGDAYAIVALAA